LVLIPAAVFLLYDLLSLLLFFPFGLGSSWYRDFGEFAKLRKATVSFDMTIRPSVRMEQLGSH